MADQNPAAIISRETIATSRPVRKINPPAKLTDGNNGAIPVLSSHREGIAAHAAAQKKTTASISVPASNPTNTPPLPQPAAATAGPTPNLGSTTAASSSVSHDGSENGKSTSKRATVEDDDSDEDEPAPKRSKVSRRGK